MKKIVYSFLLLIFSLSVIGSVNAYSTSEYTIDIPSTYRKATEGSFTKENGNNVNIQIAPFSKSSKKTFTEEEFNNLTKNIYSEIDQIREDMKKNIQKRYGEYLSESEINEYVKSFKCNSIDKKEITTATKNNYKCYHIITNCSAGDYNYYAEQYSFISNNKVYTLTVSVEEKSDLQSSEIKNIVNSFTINNYKDPEKASVLSSNVWTSIVGISIVVAVGGIVKHFVDKGKQKNNVTVQGEKLREDNPKELEIRIEGNVMENSENEDLPMNWWGFWKYFRFPVGIIISIGLLSQYSNIDFTTLNFGGWLIVIAHLSITVLSCVTYGMFLAKKKQAFKVFIIYLFLELAWNTFINSFNNTYVVSGNITQWIITSLISYGIICGIWVYPNYIYFKKRKRFFEEKEDKQQNTNQKQEDQKLKNIINNIEKENTENKEENNKKYCTKCGKLIDGDWVFCNYCGNKLK